MHELMFFCFESCVYPVDHVVICLLLLLLQLLKLLEGLLRLALGGSFVHASEGGRQLLRDFGFHFAPSLTHLFLVGLDLVQRGDVPL